MLSKCLDCQKDFNQGQEYWTIYCSVQKKTYNYCSTCWQGHKIEQKVWGK